jgi:L-fuconolactonase
MIIDSHVHFWHYNAVEHGWIPDSWAALRRDFRADDLAPELARTGVDGCIAVQASQTLGETRALLDLAGTHAFILGVVGWVPLVAPGLDAALDRLHAHSQGQKLCGFRHIIQSEPDEAFMRREDFNRGLRVLTRRGLAYDLLIHERQLPEAIALVDRHPEQTFILDHLAKPRIAAGEREPWATRLRELARRPHVSCKLSGLVTEADVSRWSAQTLRPYIDLALEAFGPARILFGSDWPVCLAGTSYRQWKDLVDEVLTGLSETERLAILGGNTRRLYLDTREPTQPRSRV